MKVERTDKGVTIELDWTEAEAMKNICFSHQTEPDLAMAIYSELDEIFTTEGT